MSSRPTASTTCPRLARRLPIRPTETASASGSPIPRCNKSIEVDLALIGHYDQLLRDVELSILTTAKPHNPNTLYLLRTGPGIGEILSLVLLYEIHDLQRFPCVQEFVSYCRLVKCAKASAGKRYGTSGSKIGNAYLNGRSRKRPGSFDAPILRARSISPAWRTHMARARH